MFKRTYKYYASYEFRGIKNGEIVNGFGDMTFDANSKINTKKSIQDIKQSIADSFNKEECECTGIVILSVIKLKK